MIKHLKQTFIRFPLKATPLNTQNKSPHMPLKATFWMVFIKLEDWEREFYRENKDLVDRKSPETQAQREEKERLNRLLGD